MRNCLLAVLTCTVAISTGAIAQQRPPRDVPYEFVLAALGNDPAPNAARHTPTMLPGAVAPAFADVPTPPGARTIGSIVWTTNAIAFYAMEAAADTARARFAPMLKARGWSAPKARPSLGGFREAPTQVADTYCRDSVTLIVRYLPTDEGGTRLRIQRFATRTASACVPERVVGIVTESPMRAPGFPTLINPPGTGPAFGDTTCIRGYGPSTNAMLRTTITPATILQSYAKQLEDSGWARVPAANVDEATGSWTRPDSAGTQRSVRLTIAGLSGHPGCVEARMTTEWPRSP